MGQLRKRLDNPLNQPSQYFSVLASSILHVYKCSFFVCREERELCIRDQQNSREKTSSGSHLEMHKYIDIKHKTNTGSLWWITHFRDDPPCF